MSETVPDHWYKYDFPLTNKGPTPSQADYSSENVAWLIEFFATLIDGSDHTQLALRYENNSPKNTGDDIIVRHPQDKLYLPEASKCKLDQPNMLKYERFAKQSSILKLFEDNSPAGIKYFNDCVDGEAPPA
jgi:hypothetical protein